MAGFQPLSVGLHLHELRQEVEGERERCEASPSRLIAEGDVKKSPAAPERPVATGREEE